MAQVWSRTRRSRFLMRLMDAIYFVSIVFLPANPGHIAIILFVVIIAKNQGIFPNFALKLLGTVDSFPILNLQMRLKTAIGQTRISNLGSEEWTRLTRHESQSQKHSTLWEIVEFTFLDSLRTLCRPQGIAILLPPPFRRNFLHLLLLLLHTGWLCLIPPWRILKVIIAPFFHRDMKSNEWKVDMAMQESSVGEPLQKMKIRPLQ